MRVANVIWVCLFCASTGSSQDTLHLLNGEVLECELKSEKVTSIKVKLHASEDILKYGKTSKFSHCDIAAIVDHGSHRYINRGRVKVRLLGNEEMEKGKFYSADSNSITLVTNSTVSRNGFRRYSLKSIAVSECESVQWVRSRGALGVFAGLTGGFLLGLSVGSIVEPPFYFSQTEYRATLGVVFAIVGGAIGGAVGRATSPSLTIDHEGDTERWKRLYPTLPTSRVTFDLTQ